MELKLYDTTLRDGAQGLGVNFSLEDKLRVTSMLADFGIPYIEGGWPGSNPKDSNYFQRVKQLSLGKTKVVAFGSTRRADRDVNKDRQLMTLLEADTETVALVGKSWDLHVEHVLETDLDQNLEMVWDSVRFMKKRGKEVVFDAEHFFDGYKGNPDYALRVLQAAEDAGADWLVLCDTNGGCLPNEIRQMVCAVRDLSTTPLGVHTHNDSELAVANALVAFQAGALMIQGTINGYGERCGNANLVSLIPTLQLKLQVNCVADDKLPKLTNLAHAISEIANLKPQIHAAFVGDGAFAHKGGIHVSAVQKLPASYEHINPDLVGNHRRVSVSELSGRGNIRHLIADQPCNSHELLKRIKELESKGYHYEAADASLRLLADRMGGTFNEPFRLDQVRVYSERSQEISESQAVVKVMAGKRLLHTAASGIGPVHALDAAFRKALLDEFPQLKDMRLLDYKVRILDPENATRAVTRVLIEAGNETQRWCTVGCGPNIIDASGEALIESFVYYIKYIKQNTTQGAQHVSHAS